MASLTLRTEKLAKTMLEVALQLDLGFPVLVL